MFVYGMFSLQKKVKSGVEAHGVEVRGGVAHDVEVRGGVAHDVEVHGEVAHDREARNDVVGRGVVGRGVVGRGGVALTEVVVGHGDVDDVADHVVRVEA
ncbi:unnamed protein product, partial [Brenthis ino]